MICDTCCKLEKNKRGKYRCAVLHDKDNPGLLPVWGPDCTAYTDNPGWYKEVMAAGEEYKKSRRDGGQE